MHSEMSIENSNDDKKHNKFVPCIHCRFADKIAHQCKQQTHPQKSVPHFHLNTYKTHTHFTQHSTILAKSVYELSILHTQKFMHS